MSRKIQKQMILIVDDNATNQMLLSEILSTDYALMSVADGEAAVQVLDREGDNISLVLLDLVMPKLDGFGVLAHMRNSEALMRIPVIIISSVSDSREIQRAYRMGAVEYFERPFDAEIIRRRVAMVMRAFVQFGQYEDQLRQEQLYENLAGVIKVHYDKRTGITELGSYGARLLGLPGEVHQERHGDFSAFADEHDREILASALHSSSEQSPMVHTRLRLVGHGQGRWYQAILRAEWDTMFRPARYVGCFGVFVDIDDFERKMSVLSQAVMFDALTGLLHFDYFKDRVCGRLKEEGAENRKFMYVFFDLDKFKLANDEHGHAFGDKVLQTVGERLRATLREGDIMGRIGGDEFVIFLEYSETPDVVLHQIFKGVTGQFEGFPIMMSMGAALTETVGREYDQLKECADKAMYEAKKRGRGQWALYDNSMAGIVLTDR